jgi:hypothetical protein
MRKTHKGAKVGEIEGEGDLRYFWRVFKSQNHKVARTKCPDREYGA